MPPETVQTPDQSAAAVETPSAEQDFDAAFDALTADADVTPAPAAVDTESEPAPSAPAASEEPAPASAAAPSPSADGNASPQGQATDDIWANAPAELREAHEKLLRDAELRVRSANGRVSALNRQLQNYRQQGEQTGTEPQGQQQRETQTQEPSAQPGQIDLNADQYQRLREEFPEVAGPLLDLAAKQNAVIERLMQSAGAFEQQQVSAVISEQERLLSEQHPDWNQVTQDDRFGGWLETQPTSIKQALQRNFDAIVDGPDAALVIGKFKQDMGIGTATPSPTPTPAPTPSQDERRQRQIASGRDPGRTPPPVQSGIPDDFDAAVDAFNARRERQQQQR
ncbi:hypothetical protein F1640_18375 [Novosphingobium sp. NBM11]|uniref:hypothetical protein n=1 Tax=Novosphingobium sp. NBM11 TaxID=2596914 RepID=UPI0018926E26|nr:hypothetical protein [Novosphingobium sp. NBM11]MBF5091922.1 hypothetical protein [Novosphingobium sp. NBM11]